MKLFSPEGILMPSWRLYHVKIFFSEKLMPLLLQLYPHLIFLLENI